MKFDDSLLFGVDGFTEDLVDSIAAEAERIANNALSWVEDEIFPYMKQFDCVKGMTDLKKLGRQLRLQGEGFADLYVHV